MRNHSVKKSQLFPDFIIGLPVTLVLTFLSHASGNSSEKHLNFNHCLRELLFFKKSWMNARRCFATNQTSFNPPTWFHVGTREREGRGVWVCWDEMSGIVGVRIWNKILRREEKFLDESHGGKGIRGLSEVCSLRWGYGAVVNSLYSGLVYTRDYAMLIILSFCLNADEPRSVIFGRWG